MEISSHQVGYYLAIVATIHIGAFWLMNWSSIIKGLKGEDGIFQAVEIVAYIATVMWPSMLMADAFFGFRASSNAWDSINIVLGVAILGISYSKFLQHKETVIEKKIEHEEKKKEEEPDLKKQEQP